MNKVRGKQTEIQRICFQVALALMVFGGMEVQAGKVQWDFAGDTLPIVPTVATLAGTANDWALMPHPLNPSASAATVDLSGPSLIFTDDLQTSGDAGLRTAQNAELRNAYALNEVGDRLWVICDHRMIEYGHRANDVPGSVDSTRCQVFAISFNTSDGKTFGLDYLAGEYNTEGTLFFTAIGNGGIDQNTMISDGYRIESGPAPNLDRRLLVLRITRSPFPGIVLVDAKYGDGPYVRINSAYSLSPTNNAFGGTDGDSNALVAVGDFSGSGAIQFEMFSLCITDENPSPGAGGGNEPVARRSLDKVRFFPGESIGVRLTVFNPSSSSQAVTVTEEIPEGWTATDISNGGTVASGRITWNITVPFGTTDLTYSANSPKSLTSSPQFSGSIGSIATGGTNTLTLVRGFAPLYTAWQPPAGGWDYIYDPDLGSPENLEDDNWKHNNGSDMYVFQPTLPSGVVWKNPAFINDEDFGGKALRMYDPGDPRNAPYLLPDPSLRKITISFDLGVATKAVAAFRVRSREFTDEFGVHVPFGYKNGDELPLLGLLINRDVGSLLSFDELSYAGLYYSSDYPDVLNFLNGGGVVEQYIPGPFLESYDNTVWHEYWLTWNVTEGQKATALYIDGALQPTFAFPLQPGDPNYEDSAEFRDAQARGAFFNRCEDTEGDIPEGNAMFRFTFVNTGDAGTIEIDYLAFRAGTDEAPSVFVPVSDWELY
ncbi:MAG TPA: hypothetical protein PLQ35_04645 [bacterium]|nr:hypothetical protein [bacterium]HQL61562.1 hypothetical protein [bacterium]